jgi:hypothetical protein
MKKEMSGAAAHSLKPYIYEEQMSFVPVTPADDRTEGNLQNLRSQSQLIEPDSNDSTGEEESDEEESEEGFLFLTYIIRIPI